MTDSPPPAAVLRALTAAGRAIDLRPGDRLLAVAGQAGRDAAALAAATAGGRQAAVCIARGSAAFWVMTGTEATGRWEDEVPPDGLPPAPALPAGRLRNWWVMADAAGVYDILPAGRPLVALVLPQLWLLQMRMWVPLLAIAGTVGLVAVALPLWVALTVQLAAGVKVWARGPEILRADRAARGMVAQRVIAAGSEAAAHRLHQATAPGARFVFAGGLPAAA